MKSENFFRLITNESITVCFEGNTFTVLKDDPNYLKLIDTFSNEQWDLVPNLLNPAKTIESKSEGGFKVVDGQVFVLKDDGTEFKVPSDLNSTILYYIDEKLPFKPLVEFAKNLSKNPSESSVSQLFSYIKNNQLTLTTNGKILFYKKVRSDFKDIYTGTFDNSVGNVVKMNREDVNSDPNVHCSHGLHVSNYTYATTKYACATLGIIVNIEVCPSMVVSVPTDYSFAKLRCCEYKVIGICEEEITSHIFKTKAEEDGINCG